MNCYGSGTTLRLFTAISALSNGRCILTGDETLQKRPLGELLEALNQLGVNTSTPLANDRLPVEIQGNGLIGGKVKIRGDISSQYISGLLFTCSRGLSNSRIELTTKLESVPYVEMTLEVMKHFGATATISKEWKTIDIPGCQEYQNSTYEVPGDYSSAAFLMVAGALAGSVRITGLKKNSLQGDARIISILKEMEVEVHQDHSSVVIMKSQPKSASIDAGNIPDLVPILAVLACQAEGKTRIFNAERLRFKESNRLMTTTMELRKMGARIEETKNGLVIYGPTELHGGVINPHNDHRIAMASIVACLVSKHSTVIDNVDCIKKSYPKFITDMKSLGAQIEFSEAGGI
jgi:3-phosphoshikimate 1-carboxyvinyltransferase